MDLIEAYQSDELPDCGGVPHGEERHSVKDKAVHCVRTQIEKAKMSENSHFQFGDFARTLKTYTHDTARLIRYPNQKKKKKKKKSAGGGLKNCVGGKNQKPHSG
jgi:hypothetical protein